MRIDIRSIRRTAGVSLAVFAAALSVTTAARAGEFGSQYSWTDDQCSKVSDPIGTVFFGTGAEGDYLTRNGKGHIYYHTGWQAWTFFGFNEATSYYAAGSRGCLPSLGNQPAESSGPGHSRYHVRLFAGPDTQDFRDDHGNVVQLATPHHEDWVIQPSCNHGLGNHAVDKGAVDKGSDYETDKGSGFDQGRRKLKLRFSKDPRGSNGRHKIFNAYWGNTRSKKQCDGDWAGSNGNVVWIGVGDVR